MIAQGRRERFGNKYVFPLGQLALRAHEASLRGADISVKISMKSFLRPFSFFFFPSPFPFIFSFLSNFSFFIMIFTPELPLFQKSFWTKSEIPDKIAIFKRQPILSPAPPGNVHKTYTNVTVHADPGIYRTRNTFYSMTTLKLLF